MTDSAKGNTAQQLVVSALGEDKPGIVNQLAKLSTECGCNIIDSRMTVLGHEFAVIMLVDGEWNALAKLEQALPEVARKLSLTTMIKRTGATPAPARIIPYLIEVVCLDDMGVVRDITAFFSRQSINIQELHTDSSRAAHTGSPVVSVNMTVHVPSTVRLGALRENFADFCDSLNLDATMEPIK